MWLRCDVQGVSILLCGLWWAVWHARASAHMCSLYTVTLFFLHLAFFLNYILGRDIIKYQVSLLFTTVWGFPVLSQPHLHTNGWLDCFRVFTILLWQRITCGHAPFAGIRMCVESKSFIFFLKCTYFMYKCSVYHRHAWCLLQAEEGIGFSGTWVIDYCTALWVLGIKPRSSVRASVLNSWAVSAAWD